MKRIIILVMSVLVMSLALPGWISGANAANPWLYENGKSRFHYARYDFSFDRRSGRKGHRHWASTPWGDLPPPNKCRAWFLSRLPGC
jgi:hypothetical protein